MAIMNFDYGRAISQASQIEGVSREMTALANRQFKATLESMGACWKGEASQLFLTQCGAMQSDLLTQARRLQELAARIREVARIIKEAEERARTLMGS
jgi:WXG100 family type VII secretion target